MRVKNRKYVRKDYTGQRFGRLIAVERLDPDVGDITYRCMCDCGEETIVKRQPLSTGRVKSCGCLKRDLDLSRRVTAEAVIKGMIYGEYKAHARRLYVPFELTHEQFYFIVVAPCFYCGDKGHLRSFKRRVGSPSFLVNGVDRKVNSIGYTINNCVSWLYSL